MAFPVVDTDYLKEVDKARRDLRALISFRNCTPIMLRFLGIVERRESEGLLKLSTDKSLLDDSEFRQYVEIIINDSTVLDQGAISIAVAAAVVILSYYFYHSMKCAKNEVTQPN